MIKIALSLILIFYTSLLLIEHQGMATLHLITKEDFGLKGILIQDGQKHLILQGPAYNQGHEFGKLLKKELEKIEESMFEQLNYFIPNSFIQKIVFTLAMIVFYDLENFIEEDHLKEMQGMSKHASKKFDFVADRFTRHLAYHGLHEVGQMFFDEDQGDTGCFAAAFKTYSKSWIIGRNFDFDIEGLFDREKILKWSFPEKGNAFLSVTWPGMVGVVTGVNENGLYASINSADSEDIARVGTPTTLILKEILEQASTLEEAIKILEQKQVFITDIFLLADSHSKKVVVIEKSPLTTKVRFLEQSEVISNHLVDEKWAQDLKNKKRKEELTSLLRWERGKQILASTEFIPTLEQMVLLLRDKAIVETDYNSPNTYLKTHLGHKGSIDSLIASQSIIFDMDKGIFYVNLGPGTQGEYRGHNLKESFLKKIPVLADVLPEDKISAKEYRQWQTWIILTTKARRALKRKNCKQTQELVEKISEKEFVHYEKERLLGDYAEICLKESMRAKKHWEASLTLRPPYLNQKKYLEEKLK